MSLDTEDLMNFLRDELGVDTSDVDETTQLFSSGVIDSTALVLLITLIEERCQFQLSPMDVTLENLDSIERIQDFVARTVS